MILAYVGGGKGKTTAGLGLVLRAWGHGMRILAAFMMKTPRYMGQEIGEHKALKKLGIEVVTLEDFGNPQAMLESILEVADNYDLILLDEFNYAVRQKMLSEKDVTSLTSLKPHVVVTGNYLWQELVQSAHLISEIRPIKHYYPHHVAVKGLDW